MKSELLRRLQDPFLNISLGIRIPDKRARTAEHTTMPIDCHNSSGHGQHNPKEDARMARMRLPVTAPSGGANATVVFLDYDRAPSTGIVTSRTVFLFEKLIILS